MSGGHFDYTQGSIKMISDKIKDLIKENDNTAYPYSEETIIKFKQALIVLDTAYDMANKIDLLVSYDDSEETFHEKWRLCADKHLCFEKNLYE